MTNACNSHLRPLDVRGFYPPLVSTLAALPCHSSHHRPPAIPASELYPRPQHQCPPAAVSSSRLGSRCMCTAERQAEKIVDNISISTALTGRPTHLSFRARALFSILGACITSSTRSESQPRSSVLFWMISCIECTNIVQEHSLVFWATASHVEDNQRFSASSVNSQTNGQRQR